MGIYGFNRRLILLKSSGGKRKFSPKKKEKKSVINIIRIVFAMFWCVNSIFIALKFKSYVRFALLWHFAMIIIVLYVGTVTVYLADIRNRNYYNKAFTKIFSRVICVGISLAAVCFSLIEFKGIYKDMLVDRVERSLVYVTDTETSYKGGKQVWISSDNRTYSQSRGKTDLEPNNYYLVDILPNSRIIIGVEKR